jgi:hypothetical protein
MGFLVSFSFFFLALVINQSTLVGQSTAESVIEFPKNDIRDIRQIIIEHSQNDGEVGDSAYKDIREIALIRKGAVVNYTLDLATSDSIIPPGYHSRLSDKNNYSQIHYNNGVTTYNESWTSK